MNYWKLGKESLRRSLRDLIEQKVYWLFATEPTVRNKLDSLMVILNYILTYLILFLTIMQSLSHQLYNPLGENSQKVTSISNPRLSLESMSNTNYKLVMILLLVRLGLGVVYVVVQKLGILLLVKGIMVVNIFVVELEAMRDEFLQLEIGVLVVEVAMVGVWAFKVQSRILHFDSRLCLIYPFAKQLIVLIMQFMMRRLQKSAYSYTYLTDPYQSLISSSVINLTLFQIQSILVITTSLLQILFFDFHDKLYCRTFKRLLLLGDVILIILLWAWAGMVYVIEDRTQVKLINELVLGCVLLGLGVVVVGRRDSYDELYRWKAKQLQLLSQDRLIQYFETLRILLNQKLQQSSKNLQLIKFIQFHRSCCLYVNCPFTKRYTITLPLDQKQQLLEEYIIKSLQIIGQIKPLLKKYLVYYLSPQDKVHKYLNNKEYYMKRQMLRIKQENAMKKELNNEIKILAAEEVKREVRCVIGEFLQNGKRFYEGLTKEIVNQANLVVYGMNMLRAIQSVEQMKANSENFTQEVRVLINNFSSRLILHSTTPILETVIDPPFLIQRTTQTGPTLLVSAQPQNFLNLIDTNVSCTKEFYFKREDFLKLKVIDLLPEQIKARHLAHFEVASKRNDFDGIKDFPTSLFVTNRLGFIGFFIGKVYSFNSIQGRIWCVAIQITHKMDSILLVAHEQVGGVVMGISQMAVFHGLKPDHKGCQLRHQIYNRLITRDQQTNRFKPIIIQAYDTLYLNSQFHFYQNKALQVNEVNTAFGFTYYLIEVKSSADIRSSKGRSSLLRSLGSIDKKESQVEINQEELNFVPQKQLFWHTDGVLRFYQEKEQQLRDRFKVLDREEVEGTIEIKGELSEGITEMRLVKDNLDFLQNIEEEHEFMSKPLTSIEKKENQLKNFNVKQEFFLECLQKNKEFLPAWLKWTRIVFGLVTIIIIALTTVNFGYNNVRVQAVEQAQETMVGIGDTKANYLELSKVLIDAKYFREGQDQNYLKNRIKEIESKIELISQEIFSIDPSIEHFLSQKSMQSSLSAYLIAFNNITAQPSGYLQTLDQQSTVLTILSQKIVPTFYLLHEQKLQEFNKLLEKHKTINMLLVIGVSVALFGLIVWVFGVTKKILKQKQTIALILMKVRDSIVQKEYVKLLLFEEYFYFDKDIYCEDDLEYVMNINQKSNLDKQNNQERGLMVQNKLQRKTTWKIKQKEKTFEEKTSQQQILSQKQVQRRSPSQQKEPQANPYVKRLVNRQSLNLPKALVLIISIILTLQSYFIFKSSQQYSQFGLNLVSIEYNLNRMQTSSDMIWILLNKFPYNVDLIQRYEQMMYDSESIFRIQLIDMIRKRQFSDQFKDMFQDLWMEQACNYLNDKIVDCRNVLNGALQQGGDQIMSYLDRKYDYFIYQKLQIQQFRQNPVSKRVSNLQSYLVEIINLTMSQFQDEHQQVGKKYQRQLFIEYVSVLIGSLMLFGLYKSISKEDEKVKKAEEMFKLIEYESIKEVKEFKLYWKEKYYDKLFK